MFVMVVLVSCFFGTAAAGSLAVAPGAPIESNTLTRELNVPDLEEDYIEFDEFSYDYDSYGIPEETSASKKQLAVTKTSDSIRKKFRGRSRIQRLSVINTDFAFNFYRSLLKSQLGSGNVVLSPFGLSMMMAMITVGTGNRTQEQILHALGFDMFINTKSGYSSDALHDVFHKLTHRLFKHNFGYTLKDFSGVYVKKGLEIKKSFQERLRTYYGADAQSVDFSDPKTVARFNQLISKVTKGKLQDIVADVDPQTAMLIYQALHFKGTWEHKFIKSKTAMLHFHTSKTEVVKVPMMYVKATLPATTDHIHECDVISLPYSANASMLIVVPYKISGLGYIERELTSEIIDGWLRDMTNRTREVYIPKFTLHSNYDLIETFQELGVMDLFHNEADLAGICDHRNLQVSSLKQHVSLKVNEEGSDAAVASLSGFMPLSAQARFMADRPFLFLIFEHHTQSLLFMGRVINPLNQ
uniref:Heparin cofactor 2-like n=1 Tax=Callorhinchus milii TaxID=7868 RepID=A0A4W3K4Y4_CALMI|eukprot:gi/632975726/ref/XP_007904387.1/ PREDICTED: heparin cofactor 2-like [Callorhinchus milii]